jgi:hypothetical protein
VHRTVFSLMTLVLSVLLFATKSEAQSFLSLGSSTVIDHLVTGAAKSGSENEPSSAPRVERSPAGVVSMESAVKSTTEPAAAAMPAKEERPWEELWVSTIYEYSRWNSSLEGDRQTNINYVAPSLHVGTHSKFTVDVTMGYAGASVEAEGGAFDSDSDSFVLIITPVQELLRFRLDENERLLQRTFLHAGMAIGYRQTNSDSAFGGFSDETETDALALAPTLLLTHVSPTYRSSYTGGAIYAYETSDNESSFLGSIDDSHAAVTTLVRADFYVQGMSKVVVDHDGLQLWAQAAWKHDTKAADFPVLPETVGRDDWAEFGAFATWYLSDPEFLSERWGINVGYSIETLRVDSTNHKVTARIQFDL